MRHLARLSIVVVALTLGLCGPTVALDVATLGPTPEETQEVVAAGNTFAWELYAQVAAGEEDNVFFSPSSIHTALAMTYAGAQSATADQMHAALSLPADEMMAHVEQEEPPMRGTYFVAEPWDPNRLHGAYQELLAALAPEENAGYELLVANALWGQEGYPWVEAFQTTLRDSYGAGWREVNFERDADAAGQAINAWVEEQTHDRIADLVPEGTLDELTRLVLVNAIYFKGAWAMPFDAEDTSDEPFHLSADETVDVPTMFQVEDFDYTETGLAQVLRMPYVDEELSMIVFLPTAVDGLAEVEAWLTATGPDEALGRLREQEVVVFLPTFRLEWQASLVEALTAMGMVDAFDTNQADFTGMSEEARQRGLHVADVLHKAFVDVNEEGTEAAAATAVVMADRGLPMDPPPEFRADHPFVFAIRHEPTGLILFIGRVMNPAADADLD